VVCLDSTKVGCELESACTALNLPIADAYLLVILYMRVCCSYA
jgi:hypothetical protein